MKQVLVVDDDPNVCKLLDFALQRAGFSVILANDGDEGFAQAREHRPEALVLDIMMPSMHGYQLCRRLRADPATADSVIVIMTARAQPVDAEEAMRAGADLFLPKPTAPQVLIEHLQQLLEEREKEAEAARREPMPSLPESFIEGVIPPAPPRPRSDAGGLVACYAAIPGVGVSTLSANLSLALAAWQRAPVGLVEVQDRQEELLPAMGLEIDAYRGSLRASGARLGWDELSMHVIEHRAGVRVLPAPPAGSTVAPALTHQAISLLRDRLAVTVADVGPMLDERATPVLLAADLIVLLTTPEVVSIRALLDAFEALQTLGYPDSQIRLVVNHVTPDAALSIEELEQGIERPVFASVPFEPAVADAHRARRALLTYDPRAPASQAIGRVTMQLAQALHLTREGT
ncbi:MAG: response regulator [Anaerolineae bacterium]|nr:response regulator [Anaerolineae bacterium]